MTDKNTATAHQGAISVVLTAHDQAPELKRNLPLLLSQNYEAGFEVVVVDESSTDDTEEVLKQLKAEHENLYTTYIPASSHYVSRRKLALTVGIKAARSEWVVLTNADCHPQDDGWLSALATYMTSDKDLICAYTAYEEGTDSAYAYLRMLNWWRQLSRPYRYDGACLAIRKRAFMERSGFQKNLDRLRGEYDFLVSETEPDYIAMAKDPATRMMEEEPTKKAWDNAQLYYMDTRTHLRRTFLPRLLFACSQLFTHLSYLLVAAALVVSAVRGDQWLTLLSAALLILLLALQTLANYRMVRASGEKIALWRLPLLDLGVAWHYAYYWLRYQLASKYDFSRK